MCFSGHYYKFLKELHMKPQLLPLNLFLFKKKPSKTTLKKCDWIYFLTLLKRWPQINIFPGSFEYQAMTSEQSNSTQMLFY